MRSPIHDTTMPCAEADQMHFSSRVCHPGLLASAAPSSSVVVTGLILNELCVLPSRDLTKIFSL